jgi:predicted ATP-grasp superfamily ATP-dependent carboligase
VSGQHNLVIGNGAAGMMAAFAAAKPSNLDMMSRLRNPAIVMNSETTGVGIIQALGLGAIDTITVERRWPPALGRFSRFPKQRAFYRPRRGETLIDALLQLSEHFDGKGVLFPSTDADLEALILARDELSERFHLPAAPHIGLRIFEKNWQYELAERSGVPIPRSVRFAAGCAPDLSGFRFPLIIKPSSRANSAGSHVFRLRLLENAVQLERTLDEIAGKFAGRDFQIAENIPGESDRLCTIGAYSGGDGKVLRSYSGRKITQHPYTHGMASIAESLTLPDEVFRHAETLLNEARFHGISQVEFKYDARDRQYKLLEIHGRSWLWVKLAAFSGVNLPLIQYYDLTGDPRLRRALEVQQNDGRFFVFDHHVKLNNLPAERELLRAIQRRKQMVSAIDAPGEWQLSLVHRGLTFLKGLRPRDSTTPVAAQAPEVSVRVAARVIEGQL